MNVIQIFSQVFNQLLDTTASFGGDLGEIVKSMLLFELPGLLLADLSL